MHLASTVTDMFTLHLPLIEKIVRPILVYAFLLVVLRLAGKRELVQFTTFDFVLLLLLSNAVQNAIIGEDNSVTGGLIGAGVLLAVNAIVARVLYSAPQVNRLVTGDPTTLIVDGQIQHRALRQLRITESELISLVRRQNFDTIHEVRLAEVEPTGAITMHAVHPTADERHVAEILACLARIESAIERSQPTPAPAARPAE